MCLLFLIVYVIVDFENVGKFSEYRKQHLMCTHVDVEKFISLKVRHVPVKAVIQGWHANRVSGGVVAALSTMVKQ